MLLREERGWFGVFELGKVIFGFGFFFLFVIFLGRFNLIWLILNFKEGVLFDVLDDIGCFFIGFF